MVTCTSVNDVEKSKSRASVKSNKMAPRPQSVSNPNKNGSIITNRSDSSLKGFRLQDDNGDTGSVYSLYKQKIDSMFSENGSITDRSYKYQEQINNCVQARIEKMFSDISKDVDQRLNEISSHSFSVDYLGSIPLTQKVTSLAGLQDPLKELYFSYRKNLKHKETPTGCLEISSSGLKVRYKGDKGDLEQLNTFPTIAVWSAVKFVLQTKASVIEYAFLPLITDPDCINKKVLYHVLESSEKKYIAKDAHSPLFTVVMRKIGVAKQLECHGFVCQTSEDAIVIAATLYKSLMTFMHQKNKENKLPKNRNGISCISVASSDFKSILEGKTSIPVRPPRKKRSTTSSVTSGDNDIFSETSIENKVNVPKPKRAAPKVPEPNNKNSTSQPDLDAIVPYPDSTGYAEIDALPSLSQTEQTDSLVRDFNEGQKKIGQLDLYSNQTKQINDEIKKVFASSERAFQRAQSIRKSDKDKGITSDNSGDILTKVTIPRSGSFLNAKGLTKYKSITSRNGQPSGGSPIGFNELFNEFRQQEGLTSLDEILGAIIDAEGMSFNDLKPIYKEFLLKLAVTLTKDELYQRSKSIMRRQKKKLLRKNSSVQNKRKKMFVGGKGLRKMFRRHFSVKFTQKFRSSKNSTTKNSLRRHSFDFVAGQQIVMPAGSSISTSSYDTRQFRPKEITDQIVSRKQSYRRKNRDGAKSRLSNREKISTSEESDFLSLQRNRQKIINCTNQNCNVQNRNSSSGYVSCSECSYDSDTCTCVSADKCYCSLGNKTDVFSEGKFKSTTASCKSEEKCYCSLKDGEVCTTDKKNYHHNKCCTQNIKMIEASNLKVESSYYRPGKDIYKKTYSNTKLDSKSVLVDKYKLIPDNKCTHSTKDVSADLSRFLNSKKCYCSNDKTSAENSFSWCGCDTDSCSDSNKCYCQTDQALQKKGGTIFEQLRERGFFPSYEAAVTPPNKRKLCKQSSTTKSSKSLEYLRNPEDKVSYYESIRSKSNRKSCLNEQKRSYSSDNLALDYELFTISNDGKRVLSQKSVPFGRTSSDGKLRSGFRLSDSALNCADHSTTNYHSNDQILNMPVGRNNEALSVKKSAEIAALFADVKLSQTTDITHLMNSDNDHFVSNQNTANQLNARINSHIKEQRNALLKQHKDTYDKMMTNHLYSKPIGSVASRNSAASRTSALSRISLGSQGSRNSRKQSRNNMYSARNGLYTIQSQSDDSHRSSNGEKRADSREYFTIEPDYVPAKNSVSCTLENSLGYLP